MRKVLLYTLIIGVVFLAGAGLVSAVTVTIEHAGGTFTGTLAGNGMSVAPDGSITIYVNEDIAGGGSGGGGGDTGCTNHKPVINAVDHPTTYVPGVQIIYTFRVTDSDGDIVKVDVNRGNITDNGNGSYTWKWIPGKLQTNDKLVTFTAIDNSLETCNNTSSYAFTVRYSSSGGGTGGTPSGAMAIKVGKGTGYGSGKFQLGPKEYKYLYAKLPSDCTTKSGQFRISMTGYTGKTNGDIFVVKSHGETEQWPTYDDYVAWLEKYGYGRGTVTDGTVFENFSSFYSGETVVVKKSDVSDGQADLYYVLIYNNAGVGGTFAVEAYCY